MSANDHDSVIRWTDEIFAELQDADAKWVPTKEGDASNRALIARAEEIEGELTAELAKVHQAQDGERLRSALAAVRECLEDWRAQTGAADPISEQK